jgi:hypothetical protein
MASRNVWQDLYGIRLYKTSDLSAAGVGADTASVWNSATADADCFIAGNIGVDTSLYGIQLLNHPTFDPGSMVINQRKAIGTSYRSAAVGMEYQMGSRVPTVSFECDATPKILALFFYLLFQGGSTEASGTPFVKTFIPYAEGAEDVVAAAALIRQMSGGTANSHLIGGAIIKSLTLSAEEGQPLKVTAEFTGYNAVTDYDFDAAANILDFDNSAPLLFQNASVKLATTAVNIPGFNVTITNNAAAKFYNTCQVTKYVLMDFTGEGSFKVPFAAATVGANAQVDNFAAGTDCLLQIFWGNETPSADGDVKFEFNARYTGATVTGEDEVLTELPFECAHDGTNNAIRCYVADLVDRGI